MNGERLETEPKPSDDNTSANLAESTGESKTLVVSENSNPMPGETGVLPEIDKEAELRIWCAVRTDLDMPLGKVANQAGHAFAAALWTAPKELANAYMSDDGQGKIVVRVKNEAELIKMYEICKDVGLTSIIVQDQGRTVFGKPTFTTMAVGPCRASDLPKQFRRLRLL